MTEFELIARYFAGPAAAQGATRGAPTRSAGGVTLTIGDDCALLAPRPGHALAVSTDMLVAGRHFFDDVDPAALGWKALAVNLSDLAAMGAAPLGFTLAIALPDADDAWLADFSAGLFDCSGTFECPLIGGDTTRGPLNVCITVFGDVAPAQALRRDRAAAGDDVWVSGTLGGAALGLRQRLASRAGGAEPPDAASLRALERPVPRLALGRALVGIAHAAIDVSDGLLQDLGHVLAASGCGADLSLDAVPMPTALHLLAQADRWHLALAGGDDYELCFTSPAAHRDDVARIAAAVDTPVTRIGVVTARDDTAPLRLLDADGMPWSPHDGADPARGFDHFA